MQQGFRRATALAILCLLLVMLAGVVASAASPETPGQEAGWRSLRAEAEGFSVELPGRPEVVRKEIRTFLGVVTEKAYRTPFDGGLFSVEIHQLPALTRLAPAGLVLEKAQGEILEDRSAEQLSFQSVRAGGHPGSVVSFRSPKSSFAIEEAHLVLVGRRLFMLTAGLAREGADRSAMDRFFNSFRVLK